MPKPDDRVLQAARKLWDGEYENWELRRSHKWGGQVRIGRVDALNRTCVFKRFSIRSPRYFHKPYRARRTFAQEQIIRQCGFQAAEPLCLIERKAFGVVLESALLFEAAEDGGPAYYLINRPELGFNTVREKRRDLITSLGKEVGRWHASGFFHGDLHPGNVFALPKENGVEFYWVDNEEGRHYDRLPDVKRLHDLDHMNRLEYNVSATDKWRFWDAYAAECGMSREEKKIWAWRVMRRSRTFKKKRGLD